MNRYLVLIRQRPLEDKIHVDSFYKIQTPEMDDTAMKVARQIQSDFGDEDIQAVHGMKLRKTFNSDIVGPLLIKVNDVEMDAEMIEAYLSTMSNEQLKKFVDEAKI